jgi:hypothetical protein
MAPSRWRLVTTSIWHPFNGGDLGVGRTGGRAAALDAAEEAQPEPLRPGVIAMGVSGSAKLIQSNGNETPSSRRCTRAAPYQAGIPRVHAFLPDAVVPVPNESRKQWRDEGKNWSSMGAGGHRSRRSVQQQDQIVGSSTHSRR